MWYKNILKSHIDYGKEMDESFGVNIPLGRLQEINGLTRNYQFSGINDNDLTPM